MRTAARQAPTSPNAARRSATRRSSESSGARHEPPVALTRNAADIDRALRQLVPSGDSLVSRMTRYHIGWTDAAGAPARATGKRVRSNLCCWAAEACGAAAHRALPAACAVELVHDFTLVHDDVQDRDELRRGRATVWSVWGTSQAINAGDGLFALALGALVRSTPGSIANVARARRMEAARVVVDAVTEVAEGQSRDLAFEGRPETAPSAYLEMAEAKTGALIGASLEAGAVMAGASTDARARMRRAGRLLGLAFQLRDDWLGIWGASELTGKSRRSDLERRKLTYPVVAAFGAARQDQRDELLALYRAPGPPDPLRIRRLLELLGAGELTATGAAARAREAVATISSGPFASDHAEEFADVARHVAERRR